MTDPYALEHEDVLAALGTERYGLSGVEAAARLKESGPNRLPPTPKRSAIVRFLSHFNNILIYVLLGSAAITASLGHVVDTSVIIAVVITNAVIGFVQEGRAEQAMDAIRHMLAPRASVLRDGKRVGVDAAEIVPGDMVLLEAGERVPADLRLTSSSGLRIEEAVLTGESVPVDKVTSAVEQAAPLGERSSMAFSGTLVAAGTGRGVAVRTGSDTEIGRISSMLSKIEVLTTPMVKQIDEFARWLTVFILLVAGSLLAYGYYVGHLPFSELFMTVVGLSVAAIPEGLPAVLTITLAIGVQAMARRNAIVRRLPAIETIGSVSVICTDKTGTLTRNEMVVVSVATAEHLFSID
ncbi:MAG: HAD-IC family P-type ATPase, partial [Bradyrhizobium sp.]|nr:HAD-IC family P-type ATPase [Bradyrhizobium sp.]